MNDTNAEMVERYKEALKDDEIKFFENELVLRDSRNMIVPFVPNRPERLFIQSHQRARKAGRQWKVVLLKARQWGGTTTTQGLTVLDLAIHGIVSAAVVSLDHDSTMHVSDSMFQPMLGGLDGAFNKRLVRKGPGGKFFELSDGSTIQLFTANKKNVGHSYTFSHLHLTEVAKWLSGDKAGKRAGEAFTGLLNTVPDQHVNPLASVVVESTAEGAEGEYHDMYWKAKRGEMPGWEAMFIGFQEIEKYNLTLTQEEDVLGRRLREAFRGGDVKGVGEIAERLRLDDVAVGMFGEGIELTALKWRRDVGLGKCRNDPDVFKQQYPSTDEEAFLASGRPVFNPVVIAGWTEKAEKREYKGDVYRDDNGKVKWEETYYGNVHVWEFPVKGEEYIMGVDGSEGSESAIGKEIDPGCAQVLKVSSGELVAQYHGFKSPVETGEQVEALGRWYNMATLVVEKNVCGNTILMRLKQLKYPRLYCKRVWDSIGQDWVPIIGYHTDKNSRSRMLHSLRDAVTNERIMIYCKETLREMGEMQFRKGDHAEVPRHHHDDRIMALALAVVARNDEGRMVSEELEEQENRGVHYYDGKFHAVVEYDGPQNEGWGEQW